MMLNTFSRCILIAVFSTASITVPATSGQTFNVSEQLIPSDGAESTHFGNSVAINGTMAVIGAHQDRENGQASGSVYIFNTATGQQLAKLTPSDAAIGDYFGNSVAVNDTTIVVGAFWKDDEQFGDQSGAVYLFDTVTGEQIAKLQADDAGFFDRFGHSVAIEGSTLVIGATLDDDIVNNAGAVYIFDATTGQQISKLVVEGIYQGQWFGNSVAISNNIVVGGALYSRDEQGVGCGAAYLFDPVSGNLIARLLPNDRVEGARFGTSVAIDGSTIIVGAPQHDENGNFSGAAYLFDSATGQQTFKIQPNDAADSQFFGRAVAISGSTALVGSRAGADENSPKTGSVYLFDTNTGQQIAKVLVSDGDLGDNFGNSIAIDNTTLVVGAYADDENGTDSGSAYIFRASPCPADLNNDNFLDFFDISAFLTAYANQDPIADFSEDGVFDFFDISAFLTAYSQGCP